VSIRWLPYVMNSRYGTFVIIFALLACSGCAVHQPWRLVNGDAGHLLIPPDVKAATLARRTLKAEVAPGDMPCPAGTGPISIKVRGKHARVTVAAKGLNELPTGGLLAWASELEATHCLAPGEGVKLAGRIGESVPLDPAAALRLLNTDDRETGEVELGPQTRLRVVSPYWRKEGVGMIDGPMAVAADRGNDRHLIATANYTENLLGEETSLYAVRPKAVKAGYTITPLYADVHIQAETGSTTERRPGPAINYLKFPDAAAFYRLFYESSQTNFAGLVIAARTPTELDERTKVLEASSDSASCENFGGELCIAIPKDVAVDPLVSVTVNGAEVLLKRGAWVAMAIGASGQRRPNTLSRSLSISKPWNGRRMPVAFDYSDSAILNLPLGGGEIISWR
jgi:hypothetical protein